MNHTFFLSLKSVDLCRGTEENSYGVWAANVKESYRFEEIGLDGMMILKWILKYRTGSSDTGQRPVAARCEYSNEPSDSIKSEEGFESLQAFKLLKKNSASWRS